MASFGERLKREREKQRVSLDDVSLSTKIGTRLLQALEEDKFDQLPGGIFNKGFVRAYARHLGLDENQAVADYLQAAGQEPAADPLANIHHSEKASAHQSEKTPAVAEDHSLPPPKPVTPAAGPVRKPIQKTTVKKIEAVAETHPLPVFSDVVARKERDQPVPIPWEIVAALLFAVALVFALWGYLRREREPRIGSVRAETQTLAESRPSVDDRIPEGRAGNSPGGSRNSALAADVAPVAAVKNAALTSTLPGSFGLLIRALDDSWLNVTVDGKKVFEETLAAGNEKSFSGQKEIIVKAGSIGDLELSFNGAHLPRQGEEGQVKTLTFGPQGMQTLAAKPPI